LVLALTSASAVGVLAACSSSSSSPTGTDSGVAAPNDVDASVATDSGAFDAAKPPENDCTVFADRTADAASRSIQWDLGITGIPERCIKIKAGQVVTWVNGAAVADFGSHPLLIYVPPAIVDGGTAPAVDEATGKATFPTKGLFGFACGIHPSMRGVVVVE
jgi:plastocyanin